MALADRTIKFLKRNSASIVSIPEDLFSELLDALPQLMSVGSRTRADEYVHGIVEQRSTSEAEARGAIGWITSIASAALRDSKEDVEKQFVEVFDNKEGDELFRARLERVRAKAIENASLVQSAMQRKVSLKGVLPFYETLGATVELRAIYEKEPKPGRMESKGDQIVGLEPIASILIELDSGFPDVIAFQAGKEDVGSMISSLQNILVQFGEIEQFARKRAADE